MSGLRLFRRALSVVRNDACVEAFLEREYKGSIFDASAVFGSGPAICAEMPEDKIAMDNCGCICGSIYNKAVFAVSAYTAHEL